MDIDNTLNELLDRGLDKAACENIKAMFDKQNRKIDRLKESAAALRDTVENIQVKKKRLKEENAELMAKITQLEAQLGAVKPVIKSPALSEVATELLLSCLDSGIHGFNAEDMYNSLPFSRLQIASAIDDLEQRGIVRLGTITADDCQYELTDAGKSRLSQLKNRDYSF